METLQHASSSLRLQDATRNNADASTPRLLNLNERSYPVPIVLTESRPLADQVQRSKERAYWAAFPTSTIRAAL